MSLNWNTILLDQLEGHWTYQLRPRLEGLTDAEYFWEPVPSCWSIRRRGESATSRAAGGGEFVMEYAFPEPEPPPVTTIAWRLAHVIVGVFGARVHSHFGGPPADFRTWEYAGTAAEALRQLDEGYDAWVKGVRGLDADGLDADGLDADGLARPVGPAEGQWADTPMAGLITHIHREVIHHGAEVSLLRDLYRWKGDSNAL